MFSVIIPVRNEGKNLARCLAALRDCEEVFVVDSGSTDGTQDIAGRMGRPVVQFVWNGGFPKKRNWALDNLPLTNDWVLFLDADEFVTPAFLAEVRNTLPTTEHTGFLISFRQHFLGKWLRHGDPFRKPALFRRSAGRYERIPEQGWSGLDMEVHEHPQLQGTQGCLTELVDHEDYKGFHAYIQRHNEYSSWEALRYQYLQDHPESWSMLTDRQRAKYGHLASWWFPLAYFFTAWIVRGGILDGGAGFVFWAHKAIYFWQIRVKIRENALLRHNHTQP